MESQFRNPIVYSSLAIAPDEESTDLLARIRHEWHRRGGIMLRVKELQTFEIETIL